MQRVRKIGKQIVIWYLILSWLFVGWRKMPLPFFPINSNFRIAEAWSSQIPHTTVFTDTNDTTDYNDTAWHDVANTTISHATLNSAGFSDTEEVLIIADVDFEGNNTATNFGVRVADTAGTAIADSTVIRRIRTSDARNEIVRIMVKVNKTSSEGFVLQKQSASASYYPIVSKVNITAMGLGNLTVDDDYVWDADTTSTTTLTTSSASFASISTPSGDSNWQGDVLVFDTWVADNNGTGTTSLQHSLQRDSDTPVNVTREEGQASGGLYGGGSVYVFNNADTSAHSYSVNMYTSSGSSFSHNYSAVIAFRASLFEDFASDNTDAELLPANTAFNELAAITPFSPQNSGDFFVSGFAVAEGNATSNHDGVITQIQLGGTNIPSGYVGTTEGTMIEDPNDLYPMNWSSVESFDTNSKDIDYDGDSNISSIGWSYRTLVTFSFGLAETGSPNVSQTRYRWRNDNGTEGTYNASPSWYDTDWGYRQSIVIDNTDVSGSSNLTNFPALISFTDVDLKDTTNSGHVGQSDGGDILFTNASGTKLDHELEKYVPSTGQVVAWVEIDTLDYNDDTTIYVYYGNAGVANQWNVNGVWDSNYKLVQHLEETTTGATDFVDSTQYTNDSNGVTIDGAGSNPDATGKADGAVQFDGSNDTILIPDDTSLDITSNFTIEAWYNADTLPNAYRSRSLVTKTGDVTSDAAGTDTNFSLVLDQNLSGVGHYISVVFEDSAHGHPTAAYSFTSSTGTWYHAVGVFDDTANTMTLYLNGSQVAQTTSVTTTPSTNNHDAYIAVDNAANLSAYSEFFDGTIDEVRVSDTNRSADWITTTYNNQNDPSTSGWLTSIGSEEGKPTGATWAQTENTTLTDIVKSTTYRLRIELSNEGTATDGGATHQLEVAETGTCSAGSYSSVPTDTSGDWQITASSHITDGNPTTNFAESLTDDSTTFVAGETKDTGNTTSSITLATDQFTEIEFSLSATTNATDGGNYCFRLTNTDAYTVYAQATILAGATTFTQNTYRFYVDNDGTNPSEVWGTPDLAENTAISAIPAVNDPPNSEQELRLRTNITIGSSALSATSQQFKLQYKAGTDGSCTTGSWTDVGASATWEFATSSVTDGTDITASLSTSDVNGQYAKSNPTATNTNSASVGQDIEYDFHLIGTNISDAKRYSFRVVESDGTVFDTYSNCPTLTTEPGTANFLRHGLFFSDEIKQAFFWAN